MSKKNKTGEPSTGAKPVQASGSFNIPISTLLAKGHTEFKSQSKTAITRYHAAPSPKDKPKSSRKDKSDKPETE